VPDGKFFMLEAGVRTVAEPRRAPRRGENGLGGSSGSFGELNAGRGRAGNEADVARVEDY